jgi:hypothetical protein
MGSHPMFLILNVIYSYWPVDLRMVYTDRNMSSNYMWTRTICDIICCVRWFPLLTNYNNNTKCKVCYMFQEQVTIIRQTFQYMDMTCSVLTVWDPILFTFAACISAKVTSNTHAITHAGTNSSLLCKTWLHTVWAVRWSTINNRHVIPTNSTEFNVNI